MLPPPSAADFLPLFMGRCTKKREHKTKKREHKTKKREPVIKKREHKTKKQVPISNKWVLNNLVI
jgi:hypothetical protein